MNTLEFLKSLNERKIKVQVDSGKLRVIAPRNRLDEDIQKQLQDRKNDIISFLASGSNGNGYEEVDVHPISRSEKLTLSKGQRRIYNLVQLDPDTPLYNMPYVFEIEGDLDIDKLEISFNELVKRQELLRSSFHQHQSIPYLFIHSEITVPIELESYAGLGSDDVMGLIQDDIKQPIALDQAPLIRLKLWKLGENKFVLFLLTHHIIFDGWSLDVLLSEWRLLYDAMQSLHRIEMPHLSFQFVDFAHWQSRWIQSKAFAKQKDYWKNQFVTPGAALQLPSDKAPTNGVSYNGAHLSSELNKASVSQIKKVCNQFGVTYSTALFAMFNALLNRYTAQQDLAICIPVAGRSRPGTEKLIGYFNNIAPVRSSVNPEEPLESLLKRTQSSILSVYDNQDVPFESISELAKIPLTKALFVIQQENTDLFSLKGVSVKRIPVKRNVADFDLYWRLQSFLIPLSLRFGTRLIYLLKQGSMN